MSPTGRARSSRIAAVLLVLVGTSLAGCLDPSEDEATGGEVHTAGPEDDERPSRGVAPGNVSTPAVGGGVDRPGKEENASALPRGTAVTALGADDGVAVRLLGPGWARVEMTSGTAATFHVHATRSTSDGPISVLMDDATGMRPNDFLSITVFVADGDEWAPVYDLLVWGLAEELRNKTGPDEHMLGFLNPGAVAVGPDKAGLLVVASSLDGVEVSLVPEDAETAGETLTVRPIVHPALVAHYIERGEGTYTGAAGLVAVEDREDFAGVEVESAGMDGVIVWQSGEGTARYGSLDHEMGHRTESGDCEPNAGIEQLFLDTEDPTGPTPTLTWGASKAWIDKPDARELCGAVVAQMVGGWERTGSGAWFFHGPLDAPGTA